MALKATIFKAELEIADVDRNYFQSHALTLARHSSETDERMMVRFLAFAHHAHEWLAFTEGLANADEPDLWQKDLTGQIQLWIEVGQPDEKRILKACGRSDRVVVYAYASSFEQWWSQARPKLERAKNLAVYSVTDARALAQLARRSMKLHCLIQEGQSWWTDEAGQTLQVEVHKHR